MSFLKKFKSPLLCLFSAVLLTLAFPKTDVWFFAWFGLVPLLYVLDDKPYLKAFGWSWLCGFVFYGITLYWIGFVTIAGTTLLTAYLGIYFGVFALGYVGWKKKSPLRRMLALASLWTVLEYVRAHLMTGFGWANLGDSQSANLFMIQIADLTGVNGVTFMIVLVNVWIKEQLDLLLKRRSFDIQSLLRPTTYLAAAVVLFSFAYSTFRLAQAYRTPPQKTATVAFIQGNIEQRIKWAPSMRESILYRYTSLTSKAAAHKVNLLIWPETAYPGFMWETPAWFDEMRASVRRHATPLLFGAVSKEGDEYLNSAVYIQDEGGGKLHPVLKYHKLHLVPFGEFIPLRNIFPFLEKFVPIDDFTAGEEYVLFPLHYRKDPISYHPSTDTFGVLICFEDTMAYLARGFAQRGANFLINITNDAWFKDTKAPYMHLQNAIFRSIENRKTLVRSANTGVSAVIDPHGRITDRLEKDGKATYVDGFKVANIELNSTKTFYTRFGDVFTLLCLVCVFVVGLPINFFNKKLLL